MSSRFKLWNAQSIRKLARELIQSDENKQEADTHSLPPRAEAPEFFWGRYEKSFGDKVLLIIPQDQSDAGEEMASLCQTLNLDVVDLKPFSIKNKKNATLLGAGKLDSIREAIELHKLSAVVFDYSS